MRQRPGQLAERLQKKGLEPIYLLHGEEPLQLIESADLIRTTARKQDYSERRVLSPDGLDWAGLRADLEGNSLFASRRLIELRMGERKPGPTGGKVLTAIAEHPPPDTILIISFGELPPATRKSKWFTLLAKAAIEVQAKNIAASAFPKWLEERAKGHRLRLSRDALELLSERTEGNLPAASQELQILSLFSDGKEELDAVQLEEIITDSGHYNVFDLIESAYRGQAARALRMLEGIRIEIAEPMAVFGALAWDLRRVCALSADHAQGGNLTALCRKHRIWGSRVEAVKLFLERNPSPKPEQLLQEAIQVEKTLKGAIRDDPWRTLTWLIMHLAGRAHTYPTTIHQLQPDHP